MAYEISNYAVKVTLVAGEDLSTQQYTPVIIKPAITVSGTTTPSDGTAISVSSTLVPAGLDYTDRVIGILQNAPKAGQEAEIVLVGVTKLKTSDLVVNAGEHVGLTMSPIGGYVPVSFGQGGSMQGETFGIALTSGYNGEIVTVAISTPARHIQGL